ncbi:hypothetical protein TNCT_732171, partial [Trichonephila clavata]
MKPETKLESGTLEPERNWNPQHWSPEHNWNPQNWSPEQYWNPQNWSPEQYWNPQNWSPEQNHKEEACDSCQLMPDPRSPIIAGGKKVRNFGNYPFM